MKNSTAASGKKSRNSAASCAVSTLLGARISAGRCISSMILAIVKVLPVPVAPSSVWKRRPSFRPSTRAPIASGWSPFGVNEVCTFSGMTPHATRPGCVGGRAGLPAGRGLLGLHGELAPEQVGVEPARRQQLLVGAALHHPALVEHHDLVGAEHGGEPVGDHEGGAAAPQRLPRRPPP